MSTKHIYRFVLLLGCLVLPVCGDGDGSEERMDAASSGGFDASSFDATTRDGSSDCGSVPFEQTCLFGEGGDVWTSPETYCSDSVRCMDGAWTCPSDGALSGARSCLAGCQAYAEQNPGCICVGDTTFGYDVRIECRNADAGLMMDGGG